MTLYTQNPEKPTKQLLELIKKVKGQKINRQKSIAFLYSYNEQPKNEIKKTIQFTIASRRIKYLEINLIREVYNSYTENYKTLFKKIKKIYINRHPMFMDQQT